MRIQKHIPTRRAVILVLTLWLVIVLTLMASSLAFEMRMEILLSRSNRDQLVAEQLARIGVARAVTDLRNDNLMSSGEGMNWQQRMDALGDPWAGGSLEPILYEVESDRGVNGTYELMVVDEESRLTLYGETEDWRIAFKSLLILLEMDEDEAEDISNAVMDWTDPDDLPRGGEGESEREYYGKMLLDQGVPPEVARNFYPKNTYFDTVDELLQIPGMTPELFYGYDPQEIEQPPFFPVRTADRWSDVRPGLKDLVTVRANKLNINTASFEVLAAAFAASAQGDLSIGRTIADRIIGHRQGSRARAIDNDTAFKKVAELSLIDGFSPEIMNRIQIFAPLTTFSDSFTIYCLGRVGAGGAEARNSRSRRDTKPQPVARVIARCVRSVVNYQGEDLEELNFPGILANSTLQDGEVLYSSWQVPTVYFKSWNAF